MRGSCYKNSYISCACCNNCFVQIHLEPFGDDLFSSAEMYTAAATTHKDDIENSIGVEELRTVVSPTRVSFMLIK